MTKNSYLRPVAGVGVCGTIPRDLAQKLPRPGVLNDMKPPHPFFPFSRCVPFKHSSTVPQTQPPRSNTVLRIKLPLLCRTDRTATSPEKTAKPRTVNVAKAMEEKKKKARCGLYFVAYCIVENRPNKGPDHHLKNEAIQEILIDFKKKWKLNRFRLSRARWVLG